MVRRTVDGIVRTDHMSGPKSVREINMAFSAACKDGTAIETAAVQALQEMAAQTKAAEAAQDLRVPPGVTEPLAKWIWLMLVAPVPVVAMQVVPQNPAESTMNDRVGKRTSQQTEGRDPKQPWPCQPNQRRRRPSRAQGGEKQKPREGN